MGILAVTLIFAGVFCILFVALRGNETGSESSTRPVRKQAQYKREEKESHNDEERILRQRRFEQEFQQQSSEQTPAEEDLESEMATEEFGPRESREFREPVSKPEPIAMATTPEEGIPLPNFELEGVLFLDTNRKFPFSDKERAIQSGISNFVSSLRRIGKGSLFVENGMFYYKISNQTISYAPEEMEKIVFYDEGFAFIPKKDLPIALFLSPHGEDFRQFLKEHVEA